MRIEQFSAFATHNFDLLRIVTAAYQKITLFMLPNWASQRCTHISACPICVNGVELIINIKKSVLALCCPIVFDVIINCGRDCNFACFDRKILMHFQIVSNVAFRYENICSSFPELRVDKFIY